MDLYTVQLIFYTLGIVFMLSLIVLVGVLIYVLFQIKETVDNAVDSVRDSVTELKESTVDRLESIVTDNRAKIAGTVGMGLLSLVAKRIGSMISKKS